MPMVGSPHESAGKSSEELSQPECLKHVLRHEEREGEMQRTKSNSLDGQDEIIAFSHMRDYGTQESISFQKKSSGHLKAFFGHSNVGNPCLHLAAQVLRNQELELGARQPSCDNKVSCIEVYHQICC